MTESVRIAHLTDPHLNFAMPKGLEWLGKRGFSGLSWLKKRRYLFQESTAEALRLDLLASRPDIIALTGDLINFGLQNEFKRARAWIESFGGTDRVIVLPGNHEAMSREWQKYLVRYWGPYLHQKNDGWPAILEHNQIVLIALSTAITTPAFFAGGRVSQSQVSGLENALAQSAEKGLCPVVLMHHPPTQITSRRKGLYNREQVASAIISGGAGLVLHGHTHRAGVSWINNESHSIPVLGLQSFSMVPNSHHDAGAWRMIEIRNKNRVWSAEITDHVIAENGGIQVLPPVMLELLTNTPYKA